MGIGLGQIPTLRPAPRYGADEAQLDANVKQLVARIRGAEANEITVRRIAPWSLKPKPAGYASNRSKRNRRRVRVRPAETLDTADVLPDFDHDD